MTAADFRRIAGRRGRVPSRGVAGFSEVAWWFITMDRSCQAQSLAEAAGVPVKTDHAAAIATREQVGSQLAGWFQFQPLLARIIRDEPNLLE